MNVTFKYDQPHTSALNFEDMEQWSILTLTFAPINVFIYPGDMKNGDIGFAAQPGRESEFKEKLELSISYAKALQCKR